MRVPVALHWANNWLCFVVGWPLNCALLWLIANRTPKEMLPYRAILSLSTVVDLAYLALYVMAVPVVVADSGHVAIFSVGPFAQLALPYNAVVLVAPWMFLFQFSLCSLCVPFIYRYAVLCRQRVDYGIREFLAMLAVPAVLSLAKIAHQAYSGYVGPVEEEQQRGRDYFFGANTSSPLFSGEIPTNVSGRLMDDPTPYVLACLFTDPKRSGKVGALAMLMLIVNYAIVFTLSWRIYRHLAKKTENLEAERARELNRQVSRTLLLQSLVPLVVEAGPYVAFPMSAVVGLRLGKYTVYETALFAWTPVLNPLVNMWVIRAYRAQIRQWLTVLWKKVYHAPNTVGPTIAVVVQ